MRVGKVVIYKALHKGDVNYRLTVLDSSTYSADSRAVTKRRLFDCEPAHTADRMVQCDKTTCAQWAKMQSAIYRSAFTYGNL